MTKKETEPISYAVLPVTMALIRSASAGEIPPLQAEQNFMHFRQDKNEMNALMILKAIGTSA